MTDLQPITHAFLINASDLFNIINTVFIVLPISHPSVPRITLWFLSLTIEGKWRYTHSGINRMRDERSDSAITTCLYLSLEDCTLVIGKGPPPRQILEISRRLYWKRPYIICKESYVLIRNTWTRTPQYEVNALPIGIVWELVCFPIGLNIIKSHFMGVSTTSYWTLLCSLHGYGTNAVPSITKMKSAPLPHAKSHYDLLLALSHWETI